MKAGFHGCHGNSHDFGNLQIGAAIELIEDEHGLLFLGQGIDGLPDEPPGLVHRPSGCGIVHVGRYDAGPALTPVLESPAEFAPSSELPVVAVEVPTAVDGDPIDPGGDAAIPPECSGCFKDLEKNVLGDVLGVLRVTQQAGAQAEDPALKATDKSFERSEVFGRDPPQQFLIVQ